MEKFCCYLNELHVLRELVILVPDGIRPDLDLLLAVGRFWGADAVKRFRFVEAPERHEPSMMESLLDRFR